MSFPQISKIGHERNFGISEISGGSTQFHIPGGDSSECLCRGMLRIFWGNISGDNIWKYLCRGLLRIFWGRFLGKIQQKLTS